MKKLAGFLLISLLFSGIWVVGWNLSGQAAVPTVSTTSATNIAQTAATLNATITNDGGSSIIERRLSWGTTPSCSDGWTASVTVSGNSFSYRLTGLQPNTTYYFQTWAKNSAGWGKSSPLSFRTPAPQQYPHISGVSPAQPKAQPTRQWLTVLGTGFVPESQVILRIGGSTYVIPPDRTQFVSSSQINVYVGLTDPGTWTVQVVNPSGRNSNIFSFQVVNGPNRPPAVTGPSQFRSDGTTSIPEGGTTSESTVVFKATVSDPDGHRVKLQIELRQITEAFTGAPTWESSLVASGTRVSWIRGGLVNASYKWRYRAVDELGLASSWVEFGSAGNTDFVVAVTRTLTVASSNPNSGVSIRVSPNDNNGQGDGTTPFKRIYNHGKEVTLTAPLISADVVGSYTFQKWQRNGVDWVTTATITVKMDADYTMMAVYVTSPSTPPDTQITGAPSGTITTNTATFTWTGSDNVTPTASLVYAYRLHPIEPNFSAFSSATSKTYSGLANGSYTFYVKARDQAGNEDPTPASRSFTVNVSTPTPGTLSVAPSDGLASSGPQGGPFSPSSKTYTLTNTGGSSINWMASKTQTWASLSKASGWLGPGASDTIVVSINSNANSLALGSYSGTVTFTNTTNGTGNTARPVSVSIRARIPTVDNPKWTGDFRDDPVQVILARVIFGEARGEKEEGRKAVGWVIRNRVEHSRWPSNYHDVILQEGQFEVFNLNNRNRRFVEDPLHANNEADRRAWYECYEIAGQILNNGILDPIYSQTKKKAYHFFSDPLPPLASSLEFIIEIEKHKFYGLEITLGTIIVTSPRGREIWGPWPGTGTAPTIRWTSSGVTGNVSIDLSRDSGSTWEPLFSNTSNDGNERWTVTGNATARARIRVSSVTTPTVFGTSNDFTIVGPHYKGFPGGYCTWYAAREFDRVAPSPGVNWRGNAQDWYTNARNAGWGVTSASGDARVGSIIVWSGSNFGHVAIVRQVSSTHITIEEMNWGNFIDQANAITENFGRVTSATIPLTNLNRGGLSFVGYILPVRPPTAPYILGVRAVSSRRVDLSWSDRSNNEEGFKIYRNNTLLATLRANATSYSDTTVLPRTRYCYQVAAYNAAGEARSSQVCTTTPRSFQVAGILTSKALSFNGIEFAIDGQGIAGVQVEVFDLRGRKVFDSGEVRGNTFTWNLQNNAGKPLANGVYLYVVRVRGFNGKEEYVSEVRKLVILR